jgi:hypothetical protein
MKMEIKTLEDISLLYAKTYKPSTDIELIMVSALIFLIIFIPYESLVRKSQRMITFIRNLHNTHTIVILSIVSLSIVIIFSFISSVLIDSINNGYHYRYNNFGIMQPCSDVNVINHYKEKIKDDFVTITFYCHDLITFSNRRIIDLYDPINGSTIYSIIGTSNESELLNKIKELNVKYFLLPKESLRTIFPTYQKVVNQTILGRIFDNNPQLRLLEDFKYVTLYTLHENYKEIPLTPSSIQPWNKDPTSDHTLIIEHDRIKFTSVTNASGVISVMYIFNQPLTIKETLSLTVKSYNQSQLVVILFSNIKDRTKDYLYYTSPLSEDKITDRLINLKIGKINGDFDPNHIEGILIGIKTEPNTTQTFEIYKLSTIIYE